MAGILGHLRAAGYPATLTEHEKHRLKISSAGEIFPVRFQILGGAGPKHLPIDPSIGGRIGIGDSAPDGSSAVCESHENGPRVRIGKIGMGGGFLDLPINLLMR